MPVKDANTIEFLMNPWEKENKDFKPNWVKGKIKEENGNKYLIEAKDGFGGLYCRLKEDVRTKEEK